MASSSLVLPSLSHKTLVSFKGRNPSLSLFGSTLSLPSVLKSQNKPISLSFSFPPQRRYEAILSPFVRNVAISSEFEQEDEVVSEGDEPSFSPFLKINVGNVPLNIDGAELAKLFELAGNVEMVEVIYHELMGIPEGFVFVTMSTVKGVEAAIQKFNGYELEGRLLSVNHTCLPQENFREARVVYDKRSGKSRGVKFATYSSAEEVSNALTGDDLEADELGNLLKFLAEEHSQKGNAWKVVIDKFKEKTEYFQKQLDNMKRLYNVWVIFCGQNGIGRNDATHTITMEPERWNAYLETHKEMALLFKGISRTRTAKLAPTVGSVPEDLLGDTCSSYVLIDDIEIPLSGVTQPHSETQQKSGDEVEDVEFMENIRRKQPKLPKSKRDSGKTTLDASIASLVSFTKEDTSIGPSMAECVESLQHMQDVVEPSPLFLCGLYSFLNLENRSIWMMLKKEESRLEWLKDLLDRGQ